MKTHDSKTLSNISHALKPTLLAIAGHFSPNSRRLLDSAADDISRNFLSAPWICFLIFSMLSFAASNAGSTSSYFLRNRSTFSAIELLDSFASLNLLSNAFNFSVLLASAD